MRRRIRWPILAALGVFLAPGPAPPARAADILYVYDAKSQLVGMVTQDGSAISWTFDENGNLLSVSRTDASIIAGAVGITLVSPNAGSVGAPVEIFGKGLANPTSLTFNGVAASIVTSDTNYIKSTVPATATTGLIHVVTPLGQADSPSAFTVLGTLTITPATAQLATGATQGFTASGPALWSVEGIAGGAPEVGTITTGVSATATYTAPASGRPPTQVIVAAQSPESPTLRAEALVTLIPPSFDPVPAISAPRLSLFAPPAGPTQASPLAAPRLSLALRPVITGVSPAGIARGSANVTLTLTGQGLGSPTALQFLLNGANDGAFTYFDLTADAPGTQATATVGVGLPAALGGRLVQITAGGADSTTMGTGANVLQVLAAPAFLPLYRGGICVADAAGVCVGGDVRGESGLGPLLGYMRGSNVAGTVPAYRAACYSTTAGTCTGWSLTLDATGPLAGYLATTAPDPASANAPFRQSGGLLLQGLGGTPSAYLWTNPQ